MRGVELGDPPGGREDHGVPLDEATLVAELAAFVPFPGELLSGSGRLLQLDVDAVDEVLLRIDFALRDVVGQTMIPSPRTSPEKLPAPGF